MLIFALHCKDLYFVVVVVVVAVVAVVDCGYALKGFQSTELCRYCCFPEKPIYFPFDQLVETQIVSQIQLIDYQTGYSTHCNGKFHLYAMILY